ncbi:peptidase dimerization domain-containing protein [Variovorax sp. LT1R16]|uniref:peptidase dimerization domain-containing protein n=1 Tax=Variovorax sp. LT1R16 TaxID=3443728 RepID=UPI003F455BB3
MNTRFLIKAVCVAALTVAGFSAQAQQTGSVAVEFQGPGGHSSSNYGRTSALHAAGRAVIFLQQANLPRGSYTITNVTGGNSVNSIASDGLIELQLTAADPTAYADLVAKITAAAKSGADAENAFRGVKVGDLTAGAPAHVRYNVAQR